MSVRVVLKCKRTYTYIKIFYKFFLGALLQVLFDRVLLAFDILFSKSRTTFAGTKLSGSSLECPLSGSMMGKKLPCRFLMRGSSSVRVGCSCKVAAIITDWLGQSAYENPVPSSPSTEASQDFGIAQYTQCTQCPPHTYWGHASPGYLAGYLGILY